MQFEVNGQDYFLTLAEGEAGWYVVLPTEQGVLRIPVYVDAGVADDATNEIVLHEQNRRRPLN